MNKTKSKVINSKIGNGVINFYENEDVMKHNKIYPNPHFEENQMKTPFMSAIVSTTGGGKTNVLMNILRRFDDTFDHIYICNQEEEALYSFLQDKLKDKVTITHKLSDLPNLKELGSKKEEQYLFVFDDLVKTKNQDYIDTLYKRGRKIGCSCIYISQSFYDTPIFLRKQLHLLILLKISGDRDLKLILSNYALGITQEKLLEIYKEATKEQLNFLKIDLRTGDENKKFSKNFTDFFTIKD